MSEREDEERTRDYCPTCGANSPDEHCATRSGRDHPSRRNFGMGWSAALRVAAGTPTHHTTEEDTS